MYLPDAGSVEITWSAFKETPSSSLIYLKKKIFFKVSKIRKHSVKDFQSAHLLNVKRSYVFLLGHHLTSQPPPFIFRLVTLAWWWCSTRSRLFSMSSKASGNACMPLLRDHWVQDSLDALFAKSEGTTLGPPPYIIWIQTNINQ